MTAVDPVGDGRRSEIRSGILSILAENGQFRATSTDTSTKFTNQAVFAELTEQRKWSDLSFVRLGPLDSSRVKDWVLRFPQGWWHTVRLYTPEDVDSELADWLHQAQRHGAGGSLGELEAPLGPARLQRFTAVFGAPVTKVGQGLFVAVPAYLRVALGDFVDVVVHVSGIEYDAVLNDVDDITYIPVDDVTGLDEGGSAEVLLKVRV